MAYGKESVKGLIEARKAFKALPEETRTALWDATDETVDRVAYGAKSRLRPGHGYRTGELQKAIVFSKSKRTGFGKVGLKREVVVVTLPNGRQIRHRPSAIGHLVEFGHGGPSPAAPHPFMIPAAEEQRVPYAQRLKAQGKVLERAMSRYL